MDTIEIGFSDEETFMNIEGRLSVDGQKLIRKVVRNGPYKNRLSGELGLISISLFRGVRFNTVEPFKLQIHLSKFPSYFEFIDFMDMLTGRRWDSLLDARIYRLDLAINLPLSFGQIASRVSAPRTRVLQKFKSDKKSLIFGKGNRSLEIYEKTFDYWDCDLPLGETLGDLERIHGVRMELRLRGDALPFRQFGELPKLVGIYPFDYLDIADVTLRMNTSSELEQVRSRAFELLSSELGPKKAAKELGIAESALVVEEQSRLIHTAWRNRVSRFFGLSNLKETCGFDDSPLEEFYSCFAFYAVQKIIGSEAAFRNEINMFDWQEVLEAFVTEAIKTHRLSKFEVALKRLVETMLFWENFKSDLEDWPSTPNPIVISKNLTHFLNFRFELEIENSDILDAIVQDYYSQIMKTQETEFALKRLWYSDPSFKKEIRPAIWLHTIP